MRLPPRPELTWKEDGTPVDSLVDDVYYSVVDGLAESRAVFLAGCGLPDAWQDRETYTIAELGFGTGLNFLAAWQMWRDHRPQQGWLNFVSFEGFPLDREDVERALRPWPELKQLADRLCQRWPVRAKGVRQIVWPDERLTLTLHVGSIEETLPQAIFMADAWFLDGFSPAKNQAMWDDALWPLIAERSVPGARAATFTVAGAVRRGLSAAQFAVEKKPGHGRKRERLEAVYKGAAQPAASAGSMAKQVAIVGAGIAGACLAVALKQRGAEVTVFDSAAGPAQGTSGNPLALVMPRLDAGDTVHARLLIDAYLSAQAFYAGRPGITRTETVHRPRDEGEVARFEKVLSDPPLGLEQLEALRGGGFLHKGSLVVEPEQLLPELLREVDVRWANHVQLCAAARTINDERFEHIVLANGWQMKRNLPDLRINNRLGQVEWLAADVEVPASAVASGPYAVANGNRRLWGATFADHPGDAPQTSEAARRENNQGLQRLAPFWSQQIKQHAVQSRAGVRASTADKVPLIGNWPDATSMLADRPKLERAAWQVARDAYCLPGLYVVGGFGSRGFTWAPWAASIITAQVFNDPLPAREEALKAIVPIRQILRVLKRNAPL